MNSLSLCKALVNSLDYEESYFAVHNSGLETMGETMCQRLKLMYWWLGRSETSENQKLVGFLQFELNFLNWSYYIECHAIWPNIFSMTELIYLIILSVFKRDILCILPT